MRKISAEVPAAWRADSTGSANTSAMFCWLTTATRARPASGIAARPSTPDPTTMS
jgi:hypothetical protein